MSKVSAEALEKVLERVRNLLARADHPNTPAPEAKLCRERAEIAMAKYRLDEATLLASGEQVDMKPEWRTIEVSRYGSEFDNHYAYLVRALMSHVGARGRMHLGSNESGETMRVVKVVGYASDLRFLEMMWSSVRLAFGYRLEPEYDPTQSDAVNAYRMRASGMERRRIGVLLFGPSDTVNEMKSKNRKATALIKKGAESLGEDWEPLLGRRTNIKTYRSSYADSFVHTMDDRLRQMRLAAGQYGSALVLRDREQKVDEAFYAEYPNLRPMPADHQIGQTSEHSACKRCAAAKSGYCREHAYLKPSQAYRSRPWNSAAAAAGADAARRVDLGSAGKRSLAN